MWQTKIVRSARFVLGGSAAVVSAFYSEKNGNFKANMIGRRWNWALGNWTLCDDSRKTKRDQLANRPIVDVLLAPKEVITMPDGSHYIGELEDGQRSKKGESWDTKGYYKGEWAQNVKEGHGTLKYNNGFVYQGEFSNDLPHGQGKVTLRDGQVLQGDFVRGKYQGQAIPEFGWCKVVIQSGLTAEGHFSFSSTHPDIFDGHGRITTQDFVYEGSVVRGRGHGAGVVKLVINDTPITFEGVFAHGQLVRAMKQTTYEVGGGTVDRYFNESDANSTNNSTNKHYVRYTLPTGAVAEGEEIEGLAYGAWTFTLPDGSICKGDFYHGERCGEWTIMRTNGEVLKEHFSLGAVNRVRKWWEGRN